MLTAWTATATAPVSADPAVLVGAADDLVAALVDSAPDASEREEEGRAPAWTSIEPAPGLDQRAVQDEHGTVVTVTVDGRVLVVAVFTPCAAP